MSISTITVRYGANFAQSLDINAGANGVSGDYITNAEDLYAGPEMPVTLAENVYNAPTEIRAKLKERVFSLVITVGPYTEVYGSSYQTLLNTLKAALFSGPLQIVLSRAGVGNIYINARCDKMPEGKDLQGQFVAEFTASDPLFYLDAADTSAFVDQPISGSYVNLTLPTYVGTAPSEPVLTIHMNGTSQFWHYFQDVVITNPGAYTLNYHPVCITIDAASLVAAGHLRSDFGDFRLQSPGGAHKDIFIRNQSTPSSLKIWFVMYKLDPGETKQLKLIYGATGQVAEPESFFTRTQFNGNVSDNANWTFGDSMPLPSLAQTRCQQWHRHGVGGSNVTAIDYRHPDFDVSSDTSVVTGFGGHVLFRGPCSGYGGIQFTGVLDITSVDFDYRVRNNGKCPFVLRAQQFGSPWQDVWDNMGSHLDGDTGQRTTLAANAASGATSLVVVSVAGLVVGDSIGIRQDDATIATRTITAINTGTNTITVSVGLSYVAGAGQEVSKYITGNHVTGITYSWATGNRPRLSPSLCGATTLK